MKKDNTLPPWVSRGVLIYGPRKSGTSLLRDLHDGSDQLMVYPYELKLKYLLNDVRWGDTRAATAYFEKSRILEREFPNFDSDGYRRDVEALKHTEIFHLRELIQRDMMAVHRNVLNKPTNPKYWVIKEVGGSTNDVIDFWRNLFKNGKVIMIIRHPPMVSRSVILDRRRKGIRLSAARIYREVSGPIAFFSRQTQLLDDCRNDRDMHFLTYEALVRHPEQVMKGVCKFLGIDYGASFETTTVFGEAVVTRTASKQTKAVFSSSHRWFDGLTLRETAFVWLFSKIVWMRLWFSYLFRSSGVKPMRYIHAANRIRTQWETGSRDT